MMLKVIFKKENYILALFLLAFLIFFNISIFKKEDLINNGTALVLEFAPVDPRSLMQGDYMIMAFKSARVADTILNSSNEQDKKKYLAATHLVMSPSPANGLYSFVRFFIKDELLEDNEVLLHFKIRNGMVKISSEAFFFQEGLGSWYDKAKFAELRVDKNGTAIITNLLDKNLEVINGEYIKKYSAPQN